MSIFVKFRFVYVLAALVLLGLFSPVTPSKAQTRGPIPIQTSPFDLTLAEVGVVTEIIKSDTLRLSNGKIFKIDNIRVPLQLDSNAIEFLKKNVLNKKMGFYIVGKDASDRADRFGHTLAHVVSEDGEWIQALMVSRGLAWVSGNENSRDLFIPLLKHEDLARSQSLGLWNVPDFAIRDNNTIHQNTYNSFQVYEGVIRSASTKENFFFFNFDTDHRTDFTIVFDKAKVAPFRLSSGAHSYTPRDFIGRKIRIRGWVEENNGPMIELLFQEQLEFLDAPFFIYYK
jgi:micrococcal nuclease